MSFHVAWPEGNDLCAAGEPRNRLLGLDAALSKKVWYERFLCPVLPLLDPIASENIGPGALRGELIRALVG
jgi:hypothetical protein